MENALKKIIPEGLLYLKDVCREQKMKKKSTFVHDIFTGKNVFIDHTCRFGKNVRLGNNIDLFETKMGDHSYFSGESIAHNCSIGKFCSIGPNVRLGLGEHPLVKRVSTHPAFFADKSHKRPIYAPNDYKQEFEQFKKITIGNDVWIGEGARIKGGVTIGDGAVIGAGALVVKNVEPYAIVGGVPANVIRYRFTKEQIDFLMRFKWWDHTDEWFRKNWHLFSDIEEFMKHAEKQQCNTISKK